MKHRLAMLNEDGSQMSRDDMFGVLTESGFSIPKIEPLYKPTLPEKPVGEPSIIFNGKIWIYNPVWVEYSNLMAHERDALAADRERYNGEMQAVEVLLMNQFPVIETYVVTGNDARGVPIWDWVAFDSPKYSYKSCTMWLTGVKRPEDIIGFICNGYFGS